MEFLVRIHFSYLQMVLIHLVLVDEINVTILSNHSISSGDLYQTDTKKLSGNNEGDSITGDLGFKNIPHY